MQSLINLENMDTTAPMNELKFLRSLYQPALLRRVAANMARPKVNIKEIQGRASTYQKQEWINGLLRAGPYSVIHPSPSMFP